MQPYMPEETLKRIMLLENRIAELEEQLMIEKEFGMHYHAEFMKLFEKGVEQDERIAEQDLLLAQWESIDELNRERSQQRLQRIAQLEAESNRRLELLREIERDFSAVCMFCRGRLKSMGLGFEVTGHADDCRLAKELSDD